MNKVQINIKMMMLLALGILIPLDAYAIDATQMLINISNQITPVEKMITGFAYLMGLGLVGKALYHMKVYGEARAMMSSQTSMRTPLTYLFVGAVFLYLPTAMNILLTTTFGSSSIMAYPTEVGGAYATTLKAILRLIQFVGVVSVIRGFILLTNSAGQGAQQGSFGKALTHIVGGVMAVNIVLFTKIMGNTLGVDVGF